ncbi:nmra-like family protein [Colletotrichum incanum]|uniref:Nmra-like family protein n=1 Tax=Colletotrichum incanum TaxID=1573173 RepID=A0A167BDT6_COLIC|nr:nmra-like family protein [Colletotrichum incanum]
MVIIAVAGGSGAVGRTIVDGLVAHGGHNVFVLSRTKREPRDGLHYVAVNYWYIDETSKVLEENQIDTVISAMGVVTPNTNKAQINLVKAAQRSNSTKRFVVSAYDMLHTRDQVSHYPLAQYAFEAIDELEQKISNTPALSTGSSWIITACHITKPIFNPGSTSSIWRRSGQSFLVMALRKPTSSLARIWQGTYPA